MTDDEILYAEVLEVADALVRFCAAQARGPGIMLAALEVAVTGVDTILEQAYSAEEVAEIRAFAGAVRAACMKRDHAYRAEEKLVGAS